MVALMASIAGGCHGRGNRKPAPSLRLRGCCHYCHLFYKNIRKIKIKEFFKNTWQRWQRPPWTHLKFDCQIGAHIAPRQQNDTWRRSQNPHVRGVDCRTPGSSCLKSDQEGNWVKSYSEKRKVTPISWLLGISPISQLQCLHS